MMAEGEKMFVAIDDKAKMFEVNDSTIWRWAKSAGIEIKTPKRGKGKRQQVPIKKLINYLVKTKRIPFKKIETDL